MIDLSQLRAALKQSYTRSLLWIEADVDQLETPVTQLLETYQLEQDQLLLLSDRSVAGIDPVSRGEFVRHLGTSYRLIIFDAYAGLNPSTLAQAIGTLEGGGVLALLSPPADRWSDYFDPEYLHLGLQQDQPPPGRFIRWMLKALESSTAVIRYSKCSTLAHMPQQAAPERIGHYLGRDQQEAVYRLLSGWRQATSCTVLDADRGRGKSSVLGLALALQCSFSTEQIALCAPDKNAVSSIHQRYRELKGAAALPKLHTPAELVERIQAKPDQFDCVLVDEAAGVPIQLLEQISAASRHLVLASTLHGYEGLARGYGLRFLKQLKLSRQDTRRIELTEPLRWSSDDALEGWVERFLLLQYSAAQGGLVDGFNELELAHLVGNEPLLQNIYQLLAAAHYRTTPADLRLMLDAPGQRLFVLVENQTLLGVLWVVEEGSLDEPLSEQVVQGRRRPNGNLIPQALLHYLGWREAGAKRFWRVVRIAVSEPNRRQGWAGEMLDALQARASAEGVDFVGASFAGYRDLIEFWQQSGFCVVRYGESIDPVAGQPAVQVLRPVSQEAGDWLKAQQQTDITEQSLYDFAHHYAPLSLVRDQLIAFNPPEPIAQILRDNTTGHGSSSKRLKPVRAWLKRHLESQSSRT